MDRFNSNEDVDVCIICKDTHVVADLEFIPFEHWKMYIPICISCLETIEDYRFQKVHLKKDDDGHEFVIPDSLIVDFKLLNEKIENTRMYSNEWNEAVNKFNEVFSSSEYRKNWNEVNLFILRDNT